MRDAAGPSCFLKVSRLEAQLLLERYPDCGNLLLRPSGDGGDDVSVTTRQTFNGCACATPEPRWEEGRAWGRSQSWDGGSGGGAKAYGAWGPEPGPAPGWGLCLCLCVFVSKPGGGARGQAGWWIPLGEELDPGAGTGLYRRGQTFGLGSAFPGGVGAGSGHLEQGW